MPSALTALDLELPAGLDGDIVHSPRRRWQHGHFATTHLANGRSHGERDAESAVA